MGVHESVGKSDEWYTPKYIFDSLGCVFDLDVAHPEIKTNVPAKKIITENSLSVEWVGFVWCNPPFGGRNALLPWAEKFVNNGNGLILTPDRTSAYWWQYLAEKCEYVLFVRGKIKFEKPDGTTGNSPANGTTIFSLGKNGENALKKASESGLGIIKSNL